MHILHKCVNIPTWRCNIVNDINKTIEKIHNYIYANDGLNNFEVLNILLKIFYIKTYDELHESIFEQSTSNSELIQNVNNIYKQIVLDYPKLFDDDKKIDLKEETLLYVMKELKEIRLLQESSDIKGHLMQRIIDRSFREGRGQFFTPAQVVDFIVKMIKPKSGQKGCDVACGTGGFMFSALEYMTQKNVDIKKEITNIDFFDISKSVTKLIAMRLMFEFSIDNPNILIQDSIASDIDAVYDFVLTNPPFGTQGKILDKKILSKYQLGHDETGKIKTSQVPDILFVEKVVNILKEGGKAAIVLPDGNFENPTSKYFREYLFENVQVDAIVSLPDGTFVPYGTGVKSSILFFTKKRTRENYNIFFGKINNLGYTFSKHSKTLLDRNGCVIEDYSKVLDAYNNSSYDEDNFIINVDTIINNKYSLSYNFYSPKINNQIERYVGHSSLTLEKLVDVQTSKAKINSEELYKYIEISDVNATGCEIINYTEMYGGELPSRASYKLKENQIIVAIAGNAIGTIWNTKAIVTKEYENCICTNGFIVLTAKKISPYLLLHFFNTEAFRVQVKKYKYGTAIPTITKEDFLNIRFPEFNEQTKDKIVSNMTKAFSLKEEVKKLLLLE